MVGGRNRRGWTKSLLLIMAWPVALKLPPPTTLPLNLVGIVGQESSASRSLCLIHWAGSSNRRDFFREGERAFGLAEIRSISQTGVVIQNLINGKWEFLGFQRRKPLPAPRKPTPPRLIADSPDSLDVIIPEETVRYYLDNLGDLLDSAYAAPRPKVDAAGRRSIEGVKISRIRKDGIVENLGFREGDVILAVNNQPLDSLPMALNLAVNVQSVNRVEMAVLREGKILHFVFERKGAPEK
jgi:type II secretory pathway component PulC